jgi:uncharacterized MAPEG superfamily protein
MDIAGLAGASAPIYALMGYVFWAVILAISLVITRAVLVVRGHPVTEFTAGVPHGSDAYWRLNRAHLNTLENLPMFAAVVLAGVVSGEGSDTFATLARVCVFARIGQSLVHLSSGSEMAINIRVTFFLTQIVCIAWMAGRIVM